jgi:hypothetical protein
MDGQIGITLVPLCLMANRKQEIRQLDGTAAEIVEIARDEHVLASQVGFNVAGAMDAGTLQWVSFGIVIDAVTQALR